MPRSKKVVSNITNCPLQKDSRVFVGNLNTRKVCKRTLQKLFSRFGRITAISMHKGYAFVQYSSVNCARKASIKLNQTCVGGQKIDVNLANEPKQPEVVSRNHVSGHQPQTTLTENSYQSTWNSFASQYGWANAMQVSYLFPLVAYHTLPYHSITPCLYSPTLPISTPSSSIESMSPNSLQRSKNKDA